jgi:D-alanine-D-alanine ligase
VKLAYPLLVKSLTEEASSGLAQASLVHDDGQLAQRVEFVHDQVGSDAIAEEYIEGRELNLAVLGNRRLRTFPVWELDLANLPEGAPRFATARVKWDLAYQKKYGIVSRRAENLPEGAGERMARLGKRIYRLLGLSGYARIDLRLSESQEVFVIEANPNPDLSRNDDFALAAAADGLRYSALLDRVLALALGYHSTWYQ